MMRIDAYTHFIPTRFYKEVLSVGTHDDIGKRMMGVPAIYDVNVRLKVVDKFKDYAQILSYPMPPLEMMTKDPKETEEYAKIVNDGFAEMCAKHPDHFPGWVAQAPMAAPDVGVREAARAMKNGRARRADLHQRRRQAARQSGVRAVLEGDEQDRHADLAASLAQRELLRLSDREEVEVRDLVDVRLVLRDRRRDVAAGVLARSWTSIRS